MPTTRVVPMEVNPYKLTTRRTLPFQVKRNAFRKTYLSTGENVFKKHGKKTVDEIDLAIPGLQNILKADKPLAIKILWASIIAASFLICAYQITNRLNLFISEPTKTQIRLIENSSLQFPAFTFCPDDRVNFDRFCPPPCNKYGNPSFVEKCPYFFSCFDEVQNISEIWEMNNFKKLNATLFTIKNFNVGIRIRIDDLFEIKEIKATMGTCDTYIAKKLIPFQGVRFPIYFFILRDAIDFSQKSCDLIFSRTHYHPDSFDMVYDIQTTQKPMLPGVTDVFALKIKQTRALNTKNDPCTNDVVVNDCLKKCLETKLVRLGNITCRLPYMKFVDLPWCTTKESIEHAAFTTINFTDAINYKNDCSCPRRCEETIYKKYLIASGIIPPQSSYLGYLFESNIIELTTEHYGYTTIDLLCDIGGNLGLFLGLSLPSVLEIFQSMGLILKRRWYLSP